MKRDEHNAKVEDFLDSHNHIGLRIGQFRLANIRDKIYCGHDSGEAGIFTEEQLLPFIEEFFRDHF